MNLQHIEYFVELSHTHNYVISAEHLHITQPSLTYAISQLEQELGVKLFEKRGRNNVLTQYGKIFLFHAEATLRTLDTGIRAVKDRAQGAVTIRLGFFSYLRTVDSTLYSALRPIRTSSRVRSYPSRAL